MRMTMSRMSASGGHRPRTRSQHKESKMKTFIKPIALLGLAGALAAGALASSANARDASAYTGANNANYYINGAYAYETAPAFQTAPAYTAVPAQRRGFESQASGHESFAYAPHSFGAPLRPDGVRATEERHLNGTE